MHHSLSKVVPVHQYNKGKVIWLALELVPNTLAERPLVAHAVEQTSHIDPRELGTTVKSEREK